MVEIGLKNFTPQEPEYTENHSRRPSDGDHDHEPKMTRRTSTLVAVAASVTSTCQNPSFRSTLTQFCLCCSGVFAFGVLHDFIQESVFRVEGFDYGWFMTCCELLAFVPAAWFQMSSEDRQLLSIPWTQYVYLTFVLAITQGTGSVALSYINFPVKVVIKSSKLIPTMMLGILILRRTYTPMEYVSAIMLCTGVASFTLVDSKVSPKFDPVGILLLAAAVTGDAFTVNLQEKILQHLRCSKEQMMFASNLMAAGWVLLYIAFSGELALSSALLAARPDVAAMLLVQSVAMYLSVGCYLALIQHHGGVVAVCVTSCRKVLTVTLSFVVFAKPFSWLYIPTGVLTLAGVTLSVLVKQRTVHWGAVRAVAAVGAVAATSAGYGILR